MTQEYWMPAFSYPIIHPWNTHSPVEATIFTIKPAHSRVIFTQYLPTQWVSLPFTIDYSTQSISQSKVSQWFPPLTPRDGSMGQRRRDGCRRGRRRHARDQRFLGWKGGPGLRYHRSITSSINNHWWTTTFSKRRHRYLYLRMPRDILRMPTHCHPSISSVSSISQLTLLLHYNLLRTEQTRHRVPACKGIDESWEFTMINKSIVTSLQYLLLPFWH